MVVYSDYKAVYKNCYNLWMTLCNFYLALFYTIVIVFLIVNSTEYSKYKVSTGFVINFRSFSKMYHGGIEPRTFRRPSERS